MEHFLRFDYSLPSFGSLSGKVKVKDKRPKIAKAILARFPSAVLLVGRVIKTLFPFKDTFGAINQRGPKRRRQVWRKGSPSQLGSEDR